MCCRDAQEVARTLMAAAEEAMREHGLYRMADDDKATEHWMEAQERFYRARADHERLCRGCCR